MTITDLSDNAWDIGMVSGVLRGIALTPTLLPNQREAIEKATEAIERIASHNQNAVTVLSLTQPHEQVKE